MQFQLTRSDWDYAARLEAKGCAVAIFTPDDLEGADPSEVYDAMVDAAMKVILGH